METIIGLLMILLPVILKLIGRRLEQAGKNQPSVTVMEDTPIEDWEQTLKEYMGQQAVVSEEPSVVETVVPKPISKQKKTVKKASILMEEEKKQKEKIDVKKLIVYSEIMKPKYTE